MPITLKKEKTQVSVNQKTELEPSRSEEKSSLVFKSKTKLLLEKTGFRSGKALLGLDLGTSGIKMAEVCKAKNGWRILNAGIVDFDLSSKGLSKPNTLDRLAPQIYNALRKLNVKTKKVAFSISGDELIQRLISLPQMPKKELERALTWEVKKYIDFPSDQICTDHLIRTDRSESKGNWDVFLVALPKRRIDECLSLLRSVGLDCVAIESKATALTSSVLELTPEFRQRTFAILDIGAKTSVLNLVSDGFLTFTREIEWGGDNLTLSLVHRLKCDYHAGEFLKREVGLTGGLPEKVSDSTDERHKTVRILEEEMNNLIREILKSFEYHLVQFPEHEMKELLLTGGGSALSEVEGFLTQRLGMIVKIFNPWDSLLPIENIETRKYVEEVGGRLSVALGLGTWRR